MTETFYCLNNVLQLSQSDCSTWKRKLIILLIWKVNQNLDSICGCTIVSLLWLKKTTLSKKFTILFTYLYFITFVFHFDEQYYLLCPQKRNTRLSILPLACLLKNIWLYTSEYHPTIQTCPYSHGMIIANITIQKNDSYTISLYLRLVFGGGAAWKDVALRNRGNT